MTKWDTYVLDSRTITAFSTTLSYGSSEWVMRGSDIWKSRHPVPAGAWNPDNWVRVTPIEDYDSIKAYGLGSFVTDANHMWRSNKAITPTRGVKAPADWDRVVTTADLQPLIDRIAALEAKVP
jgi:hypothetical protein